MTSHGLVILDTNVISEPTKPRPDLQVLKWLATRDRMSTVTTTISQAEILVGVEVLPAGQRRERLMNEIHGMISEDYAGRILPFDEDSAYQYAKILAARKSLGRPISTADAMIAAITRSRRATLATRNTDDFAGCGIRVVNPWAL